MISGLQTAGLAQVILETEEGQEQNVELGISSILVNVGDDISVSIRKNERVNADGTLGFFPDAVVTVGTNDQVSSKISTLIAHSRH